MTEIRTAWLTRIARILSVVGGPLVMVPLRLTVIGALAWRRRWLQLGAFVGAVVTSELCIGPLKALIDRPRPPGPLITTDSPSFPSGHAIAASVTALGLVVVLVPAANRRTRWTILAAVFAAVMAMSRTYLGAHWLSDVIAGACIGTGLAVVWPAALELARARRLGAPPQVAVRGSKRATPWLLVTSVVLLSIGLGCVVALHLLRPELAPVRHRLSEYANGRYGYVMTAAFLSIGIGMVALGSAIAQWRPLVAPRRRGDRRCRHRHGGGRDLAHRCGSIGRHDRCHPQPRLGRGDARADRRRADMVGGPTSAPSGAGLGSRRRARRDRGDPRRTQSRPAPLGVDRHQPTPALARVAGLATRNCLAADSLGTPRR